VADAEDVIAKNIGELLRDDCDVVPSTPPPIPKPGTVAPRSHPPGK
jgi:hypothetical protein